MRMTSKYFLLVVFLLILVSCEKDFGPDNRFIGTWRILTPNNSTLIVFNESSFSGKFYDGIYHSFEYSYDRDSITIQYKGPNKILVQPSTHHYEFKNNKLFIDFTNGCYGFKFELYNLTKIE
jgi:hypothetical protein